MYRLSIVKKYFIFISVADHVLQQFKNVKNAEELFNTANKCKNCTQSLFTREENELINKKKCYVYVICVIVF